eukprot:TRINITY_DN893_c0_g1_i1.p1 TRINITY_DN893_c0_g1~~TRINITY_DN893_c0_g1_i1.p1  ORF type:complete len:236 (-),score=63.36 TRINITY_DN893_c0_g1_i1:136-843(-)
MADTNSSMEEVAPTKDGGGGEERSESSRPSVEDFERAVRQCELFHREVITSKKEKEELEKLVDTYRRTCEMLTKQFSDMKDIHKSQLSGLETELRDCQEESNGHMKTIERLSHEKKQLSDQVQMLKARLRERNGHKMNEFTRLLREINPTSTAESPSKIALDPSSTYVLGTKFDDRQLAIDFMSGKWRDDSKRPEMPDPAWKTKFQKQESEGTYKSEEVQFPAIKVPHGRSQRRG